MLNILKKSFKHTSCACVFLGVATSVSGAPALNGQDGYINMPSARVEPDGTFSMGYSYDRPYGSLWITATPLPFLQVTGRYVSINGIAGFSDTEGEYGSEFGRYKDKVVNAKVRLVKESAWAPSVAVGATDLFGTELFSGHYVVATKTFGSAKNIEASIGYGNRRPDGVFGGIRWKPSAIPRWAVVAEYDANDYTRDFRAGETEAGKRSKGPSVGVEYRWGWLGAQVARHRDHFSANAYVTIPFSEREFLPKLMEPAYFQPKKAPARVSAAQWQQDPQHGAALVNALAQQNFQNIRVVQDGATLRLTLTNNRISNMGRAVGRASRTALAFAPEGTRAIHITYTMLEQPVTTYEFFDLRMLSDYLTGLVSRDAFIPTVLVRHARPADSIDSEEQEMLAGIKDGGGIGVQVGREGDIVQISAQDREATRFKVAPKLGFFFNDPSGALRYEVAAAINYDKRLADGLYLNSALRLNLVENISGVTQPSNSLLPHVRSDVAEYKRGGKFKLNRLLLNQYLNPAERWYARVSGGLYEDMYRGVGGQVLYLPKDARWAADLTVDALQQRGYKGWFDKRDYTTVTALGALHYRLPYDISVTARAGRFLAGDKGARMEFKRRFRSGVELGVWYTKTNGNDITSPGTPSDPYSDKGVFISVPLNIMLLSDTQVSAGVALSPWTRDVGQLVASPGDLYDMLERPRRDMHLEDGLGNFGERADEVNHPAVNPQVREVNPWPEFRARIEQSRANGPAVSEWVKGTGVAAGATVLSAVLDRPVDRFVKKHDDSRVARHWGSFGKNMPVALVGAAGAAMAFGDSRMTNIGLISMQSVASAIGVSVVGKQIIARARPTEERGAFARVGDGYSRSDSSFPSGHSAVAFAAVTPFAQEYNAPWLYGVAALSSLGRVASRDHFVSDTVAGGFIGYAMGSWLWHTQRNNERSRLSVMPGRKEVSVAWQTTY
ncbi:MAG TPA: YjbH domain-containing protein [Telluria sp.]